MTSNTTGTDWGLRAAAYELAAFSLRYPTPELAEAISSGEWAAAAHEIAQALELDLPQGFAAQASADDVPALRAEATRLFVGAPKPVCSPYEGVWRAADDNVQALLFVNPHSMEVERFCRSCGLGRPQGTNEPIDHVATELELLEYLASLEAGIASPAEGAPAANGLPGASAGAAHGEFLRDHALVWIPRFAQKLRASTGLGFYRAVADLLEALLKTV